MPRGFKRDRETGNTATLENESETVPMFDDGTQSVGDVEVGEYVAPADGETPVAEKRTRPVIDVGAVEARPSSRTDFTTRVTPTMNNPIYAMVRDADYDTPIDIACDPDKVDGVIKLLRRVSNKTLLNVGMRIAPAPYPIADDGKALVSFKKVAQRKANKATADGPAEAAEHNSQVEL